MQAVCAASPATPVRSASNVPPASGGSTGRARRISPAVWRRTACGTTSISAFSASGGTTGTSAKSVFWGTRCSTVYASLLMLRRKSLATGTVEALRRDVRCAIRATLAAYALGVRIQTISRLRASVSMVTRPSAPIMAAMIRTAMRARHVHTVSVASSATYANPTLSSMADVLCWKLHLAHPQALLWLWSCCSFYA